MGQCEASNTGVLVSLPIYPYRPASDQSLPGRRCLIPHGRHSTPAAYFRGLVGSRHFLSFHIDLRCAGSPGRAVTSPHGVGTCRCPDFRIEVRPSLLLGILSIAPSYGRVTHGASPCRKHVRPRWIGQSHGGTGQEIRSIRIAASGQRAARS